MAATTSMQFDGTLGSAKQIAAWIGDPEKVNAGPGYVVDDHHEGGLDLIGVDERGAPAYTTVYKTDWVVRAQDGTHVVFTAEQYAVAFPA